MPAGGVMLIDDIATHRVSRLLPGGTPRTIPGLPVSGQEGGYSASQSTRLRTDAAGMPYHSSDSRDSHRMRWL
jgi:hypothetical protein